MRKTCVLPMKFGLACVLVWFCVAGGAVDFENEYELTDGSKCKTKHGTPGICRSISKCPGQLHIMEYFPSEFWPIICGYDGLVPYVCCPDKSLRPSEKACGDIKKRLADEKVVFPDVPKKTMKSEIIVDDVEIIPTLCIYHGFEASKRTHRHMVALGYSNKDTYDFLCGGTLISETFVLTAAHCVANSLRDSPDVVWVGVHDLRNKCEGIVVSVEGYTLHPLYKPTSRYHDIALLELKRMNLGDNALPACLRSDLDIPENMQILGWGSTEIDGGPQSPTLQSSHLVHVPQNECNKSYVSPRYTPASLRDGITGTMICAAGSDGLADACHGDSGGPLQVQEETDSSLFIIVGVTSFGRLCSGIGVYTKVASYLEWIESVVWPAEK